jgi:small subunit ribosomal protein S8
MAKKVSKRQNSSSQRAKRPTLPGGRFGMVNYPVGDFLIRIKNACLAKKREVRVESTKLIHAVARALKNSGYLDEVVKKGKSLSVRIAYRKKEPVIMNIRLISKPGLRIYMSVGELEKVKGPSVYIVSTSKGVMSIEEAIKKRLGGEVIAEIL